MKMLEKIPGLEENELKSLEANAHRLEKEGSPAQQGDAKMVLIAIAAERRRRREIEDERHVVALAAFADKVRDKGLFDRVMLAFTEMPPKDWEAEALRAVAENPNQDFNVLAMKIGKGGGAYMNLAIGTLCADREAYLGVAPMAANRKGEKFNSGLLIDMTRYEGDGRTWHGWKLKPEAEAALRHLKII